MNPRQRMRQAVVSQFRNPRRRWTRDRLDHEPPLVERLRGRWAVELLDIQPDERVLELDAGRGGARIDRRTARQRRRHRRRPIIGDDPPGPPTQCRGRLRGTDRAGLCRRRGPRAGRHGVARRVRCGAGHQQRQLLGSARTAAGRPAQRRAARRRVALVTQPRCPGATAETSQAVADEMAALLDKAGYTAGTQSTLDLDPPAVYVQAIAVPT